jgi:hypothetical protein
MFDLLISADLLDQLMPHSADLNRAIIDVNRTIVDECHRLVRVREMVPSPDPRSLHVMPLVANNGQLTLRGFRLNARS